MKVTIYIKVSVEDELPKEEELVSIIQEGDNAPHRIGSRILNQFYDEESFELDKVTHWLREVELELPDDSEIADWVKAHGYYGHCTSEWHEGLDEGAKYLREQLLKQLKP